MSKVYIITSYYPPEIGAASNRILQLAKGLKNRGFDITVVAPLPNYPTGKVFKNYRRKIFFKEEVNGIRVLRLWIYPTNSSNKLIRLFSMMSYSLSLLVFYLFYRVPRRVIIQCPPLLVAFTSMFSLKNSNRFIVLNVSDLWPRVGIELGALKEGLLVKILRKIEKINYRKADLILGQSEEILKHIEIIIPGKNKVLYRNFPVVERFDATSEKLANENLRIVYAGLIGEAQGLLEICRRWNNDKAELHLYGEGSELNKIKEHLIEGGKKNIQYHGNLQRADLHSQLFQYDLAIIPLKKRLYGSVPSKIFEYSKIGLPLLYFGGGEGEDIVRNYKLGIVVEAGNYDELNRIISNIVVDEYSTTARNRIRLTAMEYFSLDPQLDNLAAILQ